MRAGTIGGFARDEFGFGLVGVDETDAAVRRAEGGGGIAEGEPLTSGPSGAALSMSSRLFGDITDDGSSVSLILLAYLRRGDGACFSDFLGGAEGAPMDGGGGGGGS